MCLHSPNSNKHSNLPLLLGGDGRLKATTIKVTGSVPPPVILFCFTIGAYMDKVGRIRLIAFGRGWMDGWVF